MLGPFPRGGLFPPIAIAELHNVDWAVLRGNAGNMAVITVLAAISLLLNASGLELATEEEVDLDRELSAVGLGNLVAGTFGGLVGYTSLSESTLNYRLGARSRVTGLLAASSNVVILVVGATAVSYFPKPVLGGMIVFLGLSFLVEAVYDAWFRLPRGEYALVILILVVVVMVGFLEGVASGS